jgi:deoxyribonuclease V
LHNWNISPKEAVKVQKTLAEKVSFQKLPEKISTIAGFDISYFYKTNKMIAGVVILEYPSLKEIEKIFYTKNISFPYIPGLLSFREAPIVVELINKYSLNADINMFDGHGVAHPRGIGLASHIGVLLNIVAIGCAKKKLVGEYRLPERYKSAHSDLFYHDHLVGKVLRTKDNVKPVFISVGNRMNLEELPDFVLSCTTKYRIPEPTRLAHLAVTNYTKNVYS